VSRWEGRAYEEGVKIPLYRSSSRALKSPKLTGQGVLGLLEARLHLLGRRIYGPKTVKSRPTVRLKESAQKALRKHL
jgi:hypothetical protein